VGGRCGDGYHVVQFLHFPYHTELVPRVQRSIR
jgi:hypothetical protein